MTRRQVAATIINFGVFSWFASPIQLYNCEIKLTLSVYGNYQILIVMSFSRRFFRFKALIIKNGAGGNCERCLKAMTTCPTLFKTADFLPK